jgi:hypothetical protein
LFAVKRLKTGLSPDYGPPIHREMDVANDEIPEPNCFPGIDVSEFVGYG